MIPDLTQARRPSSSELGQSPENSEFTSHDLQILRQLVRDNLGIHIGHEKDYLLISKFGKMLIEHKLTNIKDLIRELQQPDMDTQRELARFLTTNHTYFFREPSHFHDLCHSIRRHPERQSLIWCAASSTGEEVYSIIIHLLEAGLDNFRILASDIKLEALQSCREGRYRPDRLHEVPPALVAKYFQPVGTKENPYFQVKPELRRRVILKRLNIVEPFHFEARFDYIFCRNVLMYFDTATQGQVVGNLLDNLAAKGYLFVGHSEPLVNSHAALVSVGSSVYRKPG